MKRNFMNVGAISINEIALFYCCCTKIRYVKVMLLIGVK